MPAASEISGGGGGGVVQQQTSTRRRRRRGSRSASWVLQYPRRICKGAAGLLPLCHTNCNPFRYFAVRFGCVLVGLGIALVIGVVLFNNSLQSSRQEFQLKCDNIKEILSSEVENNLNASFVILGLVASVPNLNESVWTTFTSQTLFLRPNVQTLLYCQRVLAADRPSFEKDHNGSIRYILPNGTWEVCPNSSMEYAPVVYETQDEHLYLVDIASYPILKMALFSARDSGVFTLSPPSLFLGSWQMGAYLAYYGQIDPTTLTSNSQRMQACQGYIATALNITDVFGVVLSRYADDADMDVVALYVADPSAGLNTYYNCSSNATCALPLYDPSNRAKDNSETSVSWTYGTQNFELQCLSKHNLKLLALRTIIAWPLLMAIVVVFCSAIISLVLKRMNTIEKDVATMEKMNADLTAAKIAAEAADKAKSSFLATVSHEIRTPMNGVIGMTNLLMGTELTAQQLDYVKIAQASGNTLLALINDVLDLSKIEAGKMEIECVQFDIRNEIDIVLSMFDEKVLQKQLEVAALIHDSVPPSLMGDPGRIRQVLINLVGNAMKFTKEGSIFVCVRVVDDTCNLEHTSGQLLGPHPIAKALTPRDIPLSQVLPNSSCSDTGTRNGGVGSDQNLSSGLGSCLLGLQNTDMVAPRISMRPGPLSTREAVARWRSWQLKGDQDPDSRPPESKATIVVSVEDTGIGIPLNLQHRLFQPFLQADSSTSREYGGTGIGLSISQKLVKMMNGELTVNSTPEEGSVFEFTLTLGYAEPACMENLGYVKSVQQPAITEEQKLRGTRVILVDTHPVRQEASASYLRRLGIVVEDAQDIQSTLDILRRMEAPAVRAVIIDLQGLDQASALQVVQAVRKEKASLQVVALTCLPRAEVGDKLFQEAGFSYTISKPLRHSTIATVLLQALGVQLQTSTKRKNLDSQLLSGKRLLVVDDNMVNRRVATSMLSRYGATVISSNSGLEAVVAVKNQQAGMEYDLILMDIQMPEMDGYEATRQIRNWEVQSCRQCREESGICDGGTHQKHGNTKGCLHPRLPIVAVTADVMKGTHEQCFEAGMDDYISKPLDQKQLQALLERFMQNGLVNSPGSR